MTGMVKYQEFVGIVFEVAQEKGFDSSFQENASAVQTAAAIWQDRKQQLRSASKSTAKQIAAEEVEVK